MFVMLEKSENYPLGLVRMYRNCSTKIMIDTAINKHNLVEVFSCFPNKSLTDGVTSEAGPHQRQWFKLGLSD